MVKRKVNMFLAYSHIVTKNAY